MAKAQQQEQQQEEEEQQEQQTEEPSEEEKKAEGFIRNIVKDELSKGLTEFFGELPKQQEPPKGTQKKERGWLSVIMGDK